MQTAEERDCCCCARLAGGVHGRLASVESGPCMKVTPRLSLDGCVACSVAAQRMQGALTATLSLPAALSGGAQCAQCSVARCSVACHLASAAAGGALCSDDAGSGTETLTGTERAAAASSVSRASSLSHSLLLLHSIDCCTRPLPPTLPPSHHQSHSSSFEVSEGNDMMSVQFGCSRQQEYTYRQLIPLSQYTEPEGRVELCYEAQTAVYWSTTGRMPLPLAGQFKCSVCCCRSMRVHVIASQHTYHTVALLTVCRLHGS